MKITQHMKKILETLKENWKKRTSTDNILLISDLLIVLLFPYVLSILIIIEKYFYNSQPDYLLGALILAVLKTLISFFLKNPPSLNKAFPLKIISQIAVLASLFTIIIYHISLHNFSGGVLALSIVSGILFAYYFYFCHIAKSNSSATN